MSTPKAPAAPDPKATAEAQAGMNMDTAIAQQYTNATNQITPDGKLTYTQSDTPFTFVDSNGVTRTINPLVATTELSPQQAALKAINDQTETNIAGIGRDQSQRIGDLLGKPVDLSNDAVESRLFDLGTKRLNPQFARDEEALRTRLANSGIRQGSAAWNTEMESFNQRKNDALNQLALTGRGQAVNEILTTRNQPINEITALLSGSQVSQPNFVNTPTSNVAGVDYTGAVRDKYNADLAAYNQKMAGRNALFGNIGSAVGTLGSMFMFSDERVKENVEEVGKLKNGLPVYSYNYKGSETPQIGLIAQDVKKKKPDAVKSFGGILAVDYGKAVK